MVKHQKQHNKNGTQRQSQPKKTEYTEKKYNPVLRATTGKYNTKPSFFEANRDNLVIEAPLSTLLKFFGRSLKAGTFRTEFENRDFAKWCEEMLDDLEQVRGDLTNFLYGIRAVDPDSASAYILRCNIRSVREFDSDGELICDKEGKPVYKELRNADGVPREFCGFFTSNRRASDKQKEESNITLGEAKIDHLLFEIIRIFDNNIRRFDYGNDRFTEFDGENRDYLLEYKGRFEDYLKEYKEQINKIRALAKIKPEDRPQYDNQDQQDDQNESADPTPKNSEPVVVQVASSNVARTNFSFAAAAKANLPKNSEPVVSPPVSTSTKKKNHKPSKPSPVESDEEEDAEELVPVKAKILVGGRTIDQVVLMTKKQAEEYNNNNS